MTFPTVGRANAARHRGAGDTAPGHADSSSVPGREHAAFQPANAVQSPATVPTQKPGILSGKLSVERGAIEHVGELGYREWPQLKITLKAADGKSVELTSDHQSRQDGFQFIPGTDVMTFDGKTVSVRGRWDISGRLRVREFCPGTPEDFVSGRLQTDGDRLYVQPRGRERVEITHPQMKAALANRDNLGVLLPGVVREEDGRAFYDGALPEFWILARLPDWASGTGDTVTGSLVAGLSTQNLTVQLPRQRADVVPEQDRLDRIYVYGTFDGAMFRATDISNSAGSPWTRSLATTLDGSF